MQVKSTELGKLVVSLVRDEKVEELPTDEQQSYMDEAIRFITTGRIPDTLRDLKLAENTLVIFTSESGPWLIKEGDGGSAGPLLGGKGSIWEGGVRVPTPAARRPAGKVENFGILYPPVKPKRGEKGEKK